MRQILKQTSWLFFAQVLGRLIGFFYTIFLARNLGVSEFGLYATALAYFSLFSSIADFGFNKFLIREVSHDHRKIPELLTGISILRLTFTSILFSIFAVLLYFLDPDKIRVSLILLAVLALLPQSLSLTLDAVFTALQRLQYSSISLIAFNLSATILGVLLIYLGFGPQGAVIAFILGQVVYLLTMVLFLTMQKNKFVVVKIISEIKLPALKKIIQGSLIYGVLGMIGVASFKMDIIILSYLRGNFETGIYSAAYKFLEGVSFIPITLSTALFPVFSKLHKNNQRQLSSIYFKSLKIMLFLGVATSLLFILFLPIVIKTFLPNYLASIQILKILALAIPFIFLHIPSAQVLLSTDKYLKQSLIMYILLISMNLILYLIFIPKFGLLGASWVTVFSELTTLVVFTAFLTRKVLKSSI